MTSTVVHGSSSAANHGVAGASFLALFLVLFLFLETPTALAQSGDSPATDPYMDAKLTPSMAIIIVVLIAAMFFMGFFSIYIRHCSENRGGSGSVRAVVGAVTGLSRRGPRGLDPSVLQTFPTFGYEEVKGLKLGKGALECAVCLNEFEDNETLRLIPKCDHVFHPDCIDAWLSSHTTCPVCRANLASESVHAVDAAQQPDDGEDLPSETSDPQNEIAIRVTEPADLNGDANPNPQSRPTELPNLGQPVHQNRPPRSKSMKPRFFSRFPRSHSTGHSLIQPGENCERFTLRLPADVRKQLMNRSLKRTSSLVVFPRAGSSRRGFRTGGEGSSRGRSYRRFDRLDRGMKSDRWIFSMAPPFFSRASSLKSPKVAADGEGSSTPPKPLMGSVKGPLNCLSTKADDGELLRPAV